MTTKKMELLAPAGTFEKLTVALAYGADAVYAGGDAFNLRAKSDNFSFEELCEGVAYAHARGKRFYLALNAYLHEHDLDDFKAYVTRLKDIPFDAFLVADIGALSIIKETIPNAVIHISAQTNVTNSETLRFLQNAGARRFVLARELTLAEIAALRAKTDAELETFVHGALCVAYSGRCLISNYLRARDANKGDCIQACRFDYRVLEELHRPGEYLPVVEGDGYATVLSSKDLAMAAHLDALRDAGVDALKIEGRIKSVYYAANVTRVYRALIDMLYALPEGASYQEALAEGEPKRYLEELAEVTRRESDTGFFFRDMEGEEGIRPTLLPAKKGRRLMALVTAHEGEYAKARIYNTIEEGMPLVSISPEYRAREERAYALFVKDEEGAFVPVPRLRNVDSEAYIVTAAPLPLFAILTLPEEERV